MRVAVVLNTRAGQTVVKEAEERIRSVLFRCDLRFATPQNQAELVQFLKAQIEAPVDCLLIVGGDGTINFCLQQIHALGFSFAQIPPVALISSGTANDLAFELGISKKIERAARLVLTGKIREIDVIEIEDDKHNRSFMVTNGGLGLPAIAADHANIFRRWVREHAQCENLPESFQKVASIGFRGIRQLGQRVYTASALTAISTWSQNFWELEVSCPTTGSFKTTSPIVFINNQSTLGGSFKPATTFNADGCFNVLLAEAPSTLGQIRALLDLKRGILGSEKDKKSFEAQSISISSLSPQRSLTFFGDGEILVRDAKSVSIRCLHKALRLVVEAT